MMKQWTITALAETVHADPTNPEAAANYSAALANLEAARTAIQATQAELLGGAIAGVPSGAVGVLQNYRSAAAFRVPAEFRVLSRTPEQWKAIEDALREEQRCLREGIEVPDGVAALLASVRSEPAVLQAAAQLAESLVQLETLFAQIAGGV